MDIKNYLSSLFKHKTKKISEDERIFKASIEKIIGYTIDDLSSYQEAFTLASGTEKRNYQRLEFLGDAVLGSIVSGFIFEKYPQADEGFLTKMKSKIVNRKSLNDLGEKLNLVDLLRNNLNNNLGENIKGNLVEALIGAIYEDMDYEICREVVIRLLFAERTIKSFESQILSYKSLLVEWAQKEKKNLHFEASETNYIDQTTQFESSVWIGDQRISQAKGRSKKKATENASKEAYRLLQEMTKENNE